MKILTKVDLEDYMLGAVILGCGGGGEVSSGKELVNYAFEHGHKFHLADISEFKNDEMLCIISSVGGGVPQEVRDKVAPYHKMFKSNIETRIQRFQRSPEELSKYIGKEFAAYLPSETGGGNGIMPMFLNAIEGKPSVDGDGCGRAKPEIGISLTHVAGIPMAPISVYTPFMESVIIKSAVDDFRGEDMTRQLAVASGGGVTATRSSGTVKEYKKGIAKNQVSRCIKIGYSIRKARENNDDPCMAFQEVSKAYKIFEGIVTKYEAEGHGGFNWGNWYIKGKERFENHQFKVWYKNENLLSWFDEKPYVRCPDLICIVDSRNCEGLSNFTNRNYEGHEVTVFGVPAIDNWRTLKGIEIFGPKHFGFPIEYEKLENIINF
ncbi:DUF917 domain-containing protein [Candidatus Bathyarchaeota archaeon]|nr:DUF917 domain-containing protein [Candidatus Bathyarchaeota archaeon]